MTRETGRRGSSAGKVITVAALAQREVPAALLEIASVTFGKRVARRVNTFGRAVVTRGLLALDCTAREQRYDDEPAHILIAGARLR
jgi:hypothetical protein